MKEEDIGNKNLIKCYGQNKNGKRNEISWYKFIRLQLNAKRNSCIKLGRKFILKKDNRPGGFYIKN